MKNIYIVGAPRSGKTTLARMIKERYPVYNEVSFEALRNGFIKAMPDINMGNRNSKARKEVLPVFIFEYLYWNNTMTNNPFLLEGDFTTLENIYNNKKDNDIIICLGHGKRSTKEIYDNMISHEKKEEYTYNWSFDKFSHHFYDIEEEDINNYNFSINHGIKYYDTFIDRDKVLKEILDSIK